MSTEKEFLSEVWPYKLFLGCGCVQESAAPVGQFPRRGDLVRCYFHGWVEVEEVSPDHVPVTCRTLSEAEPRQTPAGASGMAWQGGAIALVFYDVEDRSFGWVIWGVGEGGNAFETDNITGYNSPDEALADAKAYYQETMGEVGL